MFIRGVNICLEVLPTSCIPLEFAINGVTADTLDFGQGKDVGTDTHCVGCQNRKFKCKPSTKEVMLKYALTKEDYKLVCDILKPALSFGACTNCAKTLNLS